MSNDRERPNRPELPRQKADSEAHRGEESAVWREEEGRRYTLLIDGEAAASVSTMSKVATIDLATSPKRIYVPESRTVFEAVEHALGLERVEEFTGLDGKSAPQLREEYEDDAANFRREYSKSREPRLYLNDAWELLSLDTIGSLDKNAEEARNKIRNALRSFEEHDRWADTALLLIRDSCIALRRVVENEAGPTVEGDALIECEKALVCLEEDRAAHIRRLAAYGKKIDRDKEVDRER